MIQLDGFSLTNVELGRLLGVHPNAITRRLKHGGKGLPPVIYEHFALLRRIQELGVVVEKKSKPVSVPKEADGFDRTVYQRHYMRGVRARAAAAKKLAAAKAKVTP